jgi:hypothetical protein
LNRIRGEKSNEVELLSTAELRPVGRHPLIIRLADLPRKARLAPFLLILSLDKLS